MTLNNLGLLHSQQHRMQGARKDCKEALKIDRELAQKTPQTSLPQLAKTLNNLGLLRSQQLRMEEARKEHKGALKIGCERTQKNPQTFVTDMAMILNNRVCFTARSAGWRKPGRNTRER